VTFADSLPALAGVLAIRGGPALTLEEVAEQSGLTTAEVRELARRRVSLILNRMYRCSPKVSSNSPPA